jgi:hypothetical protein
MQTGGLMRKLLLGLMTVAALDARAECPDPKMRTLNVIEAPLSPLEALLRNAEPATNADDPMEIAKLDLGLFRHWSGAYINDGLAWWYGVNLQTSEVFHITRFTGPAVTKAPTREHLPPAAILRRLDTPSPRVEVARVRKLSRDELSMIVCLVNRFYETTDQENFTPQEARSREAARKPSDTAGQYSVIRAPKMHLSFLPKNRVAEERRDRLFDYIRNLAL